MNFHAALSFLSELKENNNKLWFEANRGKYESVKKDWEKFVSQLIKNVALFDKDIAALEPKDCVFRINRDVRFSADKSPYKTNMGAYLSKGGKKSTFAGYYIHIEPNESMIAGGIWMPDAPTLFKVRQEIDYQLDTFTKILKNRNFTHTFGHSLYEGDGSKGKLVPKGFDKNSPAAEYLKYKSFIGSKAIKNEELLSGLVLKDAIESFKIVKPLNDFINKALSE
ncbi:MAG: DUF2461 domain-containing protein [Cytophagales bacterium]|nr:DUF2461 domain-containing protein [Cytophagales bacterium]